MYFCDNPECKGHIPIPRRMESLNLETYNGRYFENTHFHAHIWVNDHANKQLYFCNVCHAAIKLAETLNN